MDDLKGENEDLKHVVFHKEQMEIERAISDKRYASKIVQTIVFAGIGSALLTMLTALVWVALNALGLK